MKITLDHVWVHNGDDLADFVAAYSDQPQDSRASQGEVRKYASGRLRTVVRAGSRQTIEATLILVTDAELEKLDSWRGRIVMWRDQRGRLLFGTFFEIQPSDYPDGSGWSVSFVLHEVTRSVAV